MMTQRSILWAATLFIFVVVNALFGQTVALVVLVGILLCTLLACERGHEEVSKELERAEADLWIVRSQVPPGFRAKSKPVEEESGVVLSDDDSDLSSLLVQVVEDEWTPVLLE